MATQLCATGNGWEKSRAFFANARRGRPSYLHVENVGHFTRRIVSHTVLRVRKGQKKENWGPKRERGEKLTLAGIKKLVHQGKKPNPQQSSALKAADIREKREEFRAKRGETDSVKKTDRCFGRTEKAGNQGRDFPR